MMLVAVWDAMYGAIPRLQAEEQLAAYNVAVVATPPVDRQGLHDREKVLAGWRQQMQGAGDRSVSTARRVSFRELQHVLRGAFEEQIRD